jgi:hypothetical protein
MNEACPYDIMNPACVRLMGEFPMDTGSLRAYLTSFCKGQETNPDMKEICACFYDSSFYDKILEQMQDRFVIPRALLTDTRKCIFPPCNESALKYDAPIVECDAINLTNCIQTIHLDSSGNLGHITIKNTGICRNIRPRSQGCSATCVRPAECVNGTCQNVSPCTTDTECGTDADGKPRVCKAGLCADADKTEDTNPWVYVAVAVGVLALVAGLAWVLKRSVMRKT